MARMTEDARFTALTEKTLTGQASDTERAELAELLDKRKAREELPAAEAKTAKAREELEACEAYEAAVRERAGEKKGRRR